jgi:kumamolisin
VRGLGGNQGHSLQDSDYLVRYIVATRWPVESEVEVSQFPSFQRASATIRSPAGKALQQGCVPYLNRSDRRIASYVGAPLVRWTVPELCKAYSWPTGLKGGGVIAIVELDGGWEPADLKAFFDSIGQPMPNITDRSVDGTQNNPGQHIGEEHDPDIEVALDIQVAATSYFVATNAPAVIRMYWAAEDNPGSIAAAIRAAADEGCDVCSISWGTDEANWNKWGDNLILDLEAAAEAATTKGMVVLASTGDNDSSDGGDTPANVDAPSSCPHVLACGGTSKTATSEVVWNNDPGQTNGYGTGGGYSTVFPRQSFQIGAPYPPKYLPGGDPPGAGRMVPDLAANADPNTGYWMFIHGNKIPMGGTSAVTPLYAGLFAAFGTKLGFITPKLWQNATCFNDITQGDNGTYQALAGPDPCTGLGSPVGIKLAALFAAPASAKPSSAASAAPAPRAVGNGWSGAVTYKYSNGILTAAPEITRSAVATAGLTVIFPRVQLAPAGTYTVLHGHHYSATVTLNFLEGFASNDTIVGMLDSAGFTDVSVTGSGETRQAQGLWPGPTTTAALDPHLSNVVDLG